jgi:hypothetical protein
MLGSFHKSVDAAARPVSRVAAAPTAATLERVRNRRNRPSALTQQQLGGRYIAGSGVEPGMGLLDPSQPRRSGIAARRPA